MKIDTTREYPPGSVLDKINDLAYNALEPYRTALQKAHIIENRKFERYRTAMQETAKELRLRENLMLLDSLIVPKHKPK